MKKYNKYIAVLLSTILVLGCTDPFEDEIKEIDQGLNEPVVQFDYTLTDADYETIADNIRAAAENAADSALGDWVEDNLALSNSISAGTYVPAILDETYPHLGAGSAIIVGYNKFEGDNTDFSVYTSASVFAVSDASYDALGGDASTYKLFTLAQSPEDNLPDILGGILTNAEEGDIVLTDYKYVDEVLDPSVSLTMGSTEYQSLVDYAGATFGTEWVDPGFGTLDYYYRANSFFLNFDARVDRRKEDYVTHTLTDDIFDGSTGPEDDSIRVEARIQEGIIKFLELTYPNAVPQINGQEVFYNIGYLVFYGASSVNWYVQYRVTSAGPNPVFELSMAPQTEPIPSLSPSDDRGDYYIYNGTEWAKDNTTINLYASDYAAMGNPGNQNRFSMDDTPSAYIPDFLAGRISFSQEGDTQRISYNYNDGNDTNRLVEIYTFVNGAWVGALFTPTAEQFVNNGTNWVFDPSIVRTMTSADYQVIVEVVKGTHPELVSSFGTGEDLYGADSFFENFDIRATSKTEQSEYDGLSASEAEALAIEKAGEGIVIFLEQTYPNQTPQVNGVDVFATITAATFNGADATIVTKLQVTGVGEFTIVEGPTVQ